MIAKVGFGINNEVKNIKKITTKLYAKEDLQNNYHLRSLEKCTLHKNDQELGGRSQRQVLSFQNQSEKGHNELTACGQFLHQKNLKQRC